MEVGICYQVIRLEVELGDGGGGGLCGQLFIFGDAKNEKKKRLKKIDYFGKQR